MSRVSNKIRILYTLTSFATLPTLVEAVEADRGAIDGLSIEDRAAVSGLQVPDGLTVSLFANHEQMANPVALDIDKDGRVYVAETYRFNRGTAENRSQSFMLDDDLQVMTLGERMAMYEKWAWRLEGGMAWFTSRKDRIKLLTDTDTDGSRSWVRGSQRAGGDRRGNAREGERLSGSDRGPGAQRFFWREVSRAIPGTQQNAPALSFAFNASG